MCLGVFLYVHLYHLQLEFHTAVSQHVGARIRIQVHERAAGALNPWAISSPTSFWGEGRAGRHGLLM